MLRRSVALLFAFASLCAQDGPYVQWQGQRATIYRLEEGHLETQEATAPFTLQVPGGATLRLTGKPYPPDGDRFPSPARIVAVSDVHGHLDDLLTLLKAHGVVDHRLHWRYGKGHLVIAGDVVDRGYQVTQALWFIRGLEEEAQRAGGRVHLLLGNHEHMVAVGDLRYTDPLYVNTPEGMPSVVDRFGPDSEFGRWLRSKPALLKLGPFLFLHGGISADFVARGYDLHGANQVLDAHFGERGGTGKDEASFLMGPLGPLWFRGLFPGEQGELIQAQVEEILATFQVQALVVGHTTVDQVEALRNGRVYAIDAGLKEGRGELWIWDHGKVFRGLKDGRRVPLP